MVQTLQIFRAPQSISGPSRASASSSGSSQDQDPLENASIDSRGRAPDNGPLIPNPATYPNVYEKSPRDQMETTWGFGAAENRYNRQIESAVERVWPHGQDFTLSPLTFKALVAAESAFKKDAVSPTGAVGLVQITTGTAQAYGLKTSSPDERRLPDKALPVGVKILADKLSVIKNPDSKQDYAKPVLDHYAQHGLPNAEQMETLALAGYNGGGSTVVRAMSYAIADGKDPKEYSNLIAADRPVRETPLYKAIRDTFGEKFAESKYREMADYPGKIHGIEARAFEPLQGRRIMVDPGHGGSDPGAVGPTGVRESDVVLSVGLKMKEKLEALGAEVRMTRDTDRNVAFPGASQREELRARVSLANSWPAQVFVSVHANSATNPSAHGTETFHSREASATSKRLASNVNQEMVQATGFRNRGVKMADFHVIKNTNMPAILVETGFVSNAVEEKIIADPEMQDTMAQAIVNGIEQTFAQNISSEFFSYADAGHVFAAPLG